jgi:hypothetical protein
MYLNQYILILQACLPYHFSSGTKETILLGLAEAELCNSRPRALTMLDWIIAPSRKEIGHFRCCCIGLDIYLEFGR